MRKVTASAVILTALTGCGQSSGIPSTQWSFEVPTGNKAQGIQSESRSNSRAAGSELSADAQLFLNEAYGKEMMGPAFEQPLVADSSIGTTGLSTGSPKLNTVASATSGIVSAASARPDPVEQVRAYLRSSGSPTTLTSRTPYVSQVYLASVPAAAQSYVPAGPISVPANDGTLPTNPSFIGAGVPAATSPDTFASAIIPPVTVADASSFEASPFEPSSFEPSPFSTTATTFAPATSYSDTGAEPYADTGAQPYAEETYADNSYQADSPRILEDGLPQLAPSIDITVIPAEQSESETAQADEISIGTSILQDLQQRSANAEETGTAPVQTAQASSEFTPQESEASPTVESLLRTMPQREVAPLVANRRTAVGLAQSLEESSAQLEFSGLSTSANTDLGVANVEMLNVSGSQANPPAANSIFKAPSAVPELAIEADLHSNAASRSELLEGLRHTQAPSTIYVPIADANIADVSGDLIQSAVVALGEEASTAALIDEIAFQNAFSSVLMSPALLNSEAPLTSEVPLASSEELLANRPQEQINSAAPHIEIFTDELLTNELFTDEFSTGIMASTAKASTQRTISANGLTKQFAKAPGQKALIQGARPLALHHSTSHHSILGALGQAPREGRQLITWK